MTKARRRQAGEGSISEYKTQAGPRFLIKYAAPREDGSMRYVLRRGYPTRADAAKALRDQITSVDRGVHVAPAKVTVEQFLTEWLDSVRLRPTTAVSYRRNIEVHVVPYIGALRLDQLTGTRLTALYRKLELDGRADGKGGLSARSVKYVATILHGAFKAAVRDGRLVANPADRATPPSARDAKAPEMHTWTSEELRTFLDWSKSIDDELWIAWLVLAMTGMRRGEVLALRWGDVDFDGATVSVRRAATLIKAKGQGEHIVVGPPKSGKSRVIDLDPQTLAALRAHKTARGLLSLSFARDDAYVLGTLDGAVRQPDHFSRRFVTRVAAYRAKLGEDALSLLTMHGLRHTHATLLLRIGQHPKIVSERLGHSTVTVTMEVYSHALPTLQREAAVKLAALVYGSGV